ncbi:MAG: CCA tRNA nucleotidyltransferase [Clostridium sp.]
MDIFISEVVEKCIEKLKEAGFEAFVVGGCVRDSIIARIPNDWDVCTSALPSQTKLVFKEYRTVDVGIDHGTVTVVMENENIEITTYRVDGEYKDNRRPEKVEFTFKIQEDLSRRDFTINAMAYNHESGLIDFFNGRQDIDKRIIRCVGDPIKRFNEDALRIMRALRFAAQLNYTIEEDTLKAVKGSKELLRNISSERIAVELNKLVMAEKPKDMIKLLFEMDIFKIIIEYMHNCSVKVDNLNNFTEDCGQIIEACPQDLSIRLCVLFNFIAELYKIEDDSKSVVENFEVEKFFRSLKYDNITIKEIDILNRYYNSDISYEKREIKKILNLIDLEMFKKLIFMKTAIERNFSSDRYIKLLNSIEENNECYRIKDLKINGRDLIAQGIKNGKVIGESLNTALQIVIENPEMNDRERLLKEIKKIN